MKKIVKFLFIIMLLMSLSACNFEQKEDIYILYTNDVSGQARENVGYAGVKGYMDNIKSKHKYVTLVDAGDFIEGKLAEKSDGKYIVDIMNAVGYDFVTLGNQDFSFGLDVLSKSINASNFQYVSCNIKYLGSGNNPLKNVKPYVIKRYGWTKVAFIGVTTPETILKSGKPAYEAVTEDGKPLFYFYEDDDGQALYDQIQKTVDKVRKKADYVVLLSHLGSNSTIEGFNSYDVIYNTTGIDVVIDGHSHTIIHGEGVPNKEGGIVVLTSTGHDIENLGVLIMHTNHTYTTTLYSSVDDKDPVVEELVNSYYSAIGE